MMRLVVPTRGVANATVAADQPAEFTPPDGELNVVLHSPVGGRPQLGQRPGLRKSFAERLGRDGNREVQGMARISRASAITKFTLGATITVTGTAKRSELIAGNCYVFNPARDGSIDALTVAGSSGAVTQTRASEDSTQTVTAAIGFPNTDTPSWAAMHPSSTLAVFGFDYLSSGQNRVLLVFVDPRDGQPLGYRRIAPASEASIDNAISGGAVFTDTALWVARGTKLHRIGVEQVGAYLVPTGAFDVPAATETGVSVAGVGRITGIAACKPSGWRLYGCFDGESSSGTLAGPTTTLAAGYPARCVRAGVTAWDEVGAGCVRVAMGGTPTLLDAYVEVASGIPIVHNTLRFSQVLDRAPRGCIPTAIAAQPDGTGFVVAFTNDGWGPTVADFPPDGNRAASTLARFDSNGVMEWEIDAQSRIPGEAGGKRATVATTYPCDLPDEDGTNAGTTSKDGPAIRALAIDRTGIVYAAGRISAGRFNVFSFGAAGGSLRWRARTESNNPTDGTPDAWAAPGAAGRGTPARCIGIDGADGRVVVVGKTNRTHAAQATRTRSAHVFRLDPADGVIVSVWSVSADDEANGTSPVALAVGSGVSALGTPPYTNVDL